MEVMGKIGEGKRFVHLPAIVFVGLFRCTNSIRKLLLAYKSLIIEHYEEICLAQLTGHALCSLVYKIPEK